MPPLACPITAIGGTDDRESEGDHLEGWRIHTAGAFTSRLVPGDHFFVHSAIPSLIAVLTNTLRPHIAPEASRP